MKIITFIINIILCLYGYYLTKSILFLLLLPFSIINQCYFNMKNKKIYNIFRFLDYLIAILILIQLSYKYDKIWLFLTILIFYWHLQFKSLNNYYFKVNIWHIYLILSLYYYYH